jgi:CRISPR-associated protein (TIGR03986 family)
MTNKPYRIRVRTLDGKPRNQNELNRLKSNQLKMPHLDILLTDAPGEFVICAAADKHIQQVRDRLSSVGLEEIAGGDTTVPAAARPMPQQGLRQDMSQDRGRRERSKRQQPGSARGSSEEPPSDLRKKPYGFVGLPERFTTAEPVWHDGTSSTGRLSGEVRFELETLTPLLVGWERGQVGDAESEWPVPETLNGVGHLAQGKSVLCSLRAPWGKRPVIIPGDTLKGLLRHELGALLGAPMERVAERSYSYRPNAMFPKDPNPRLIARLARIPEEGVEIVQLDGIPVRVPSKLELLSTSLRYDKSGALSNNYYRFIKSGGLCYRGGIGAGHTLNSKHKLFQGILAVPSTPTQTINVPQTAKHGYLATLRHLVDLDHGHFSERHPDVIETIIGEAAKKRISKRHPDVLKTITGEAAKKHILEAAANKVFQPGDLIWVEWDTERECIVSFGWHYYYRWAYVDTVHRDADALNGERRGLFPLADERAQDGDGAPRALSPVRRLFGYTGDNEGSKGIGKGDYEQLMGRVSINAALEVVGEDEADNRRFLPPTFLRELGMPRPSAVEFYLQQPYHPNPRPSDRATLVTYGDAAGYDEPGELAGRKFYLDRSDAYTGEPWKDDSEANRANERSTLALEASKPERKFRFTLRFRDLEPAELAAVLVALCPHQFREVLGGAHPDGYCSKLGYARPLGWGSVRIEAKALLFLELANGRPQLRAEQDIVTWVRQHYQTTEMQAAWLDIHRHKHPDAADYPRARDKDGNEHIYTWHTKLRAEHSRLRRYKKE